MNDIEHQINSDLIISKEICLSNNRQILVKRCFELLQIVENRKFEILIGNFEDAINDSILNLIKSVIKEKQNVNVKRLEQLEDLLEYADKINVDMAIFHANNLQCLCRHENYDDGLLSVLRLFDMFKNIYKVPVIVISGASSKFNNLVPKEKVLANFYFSSPFDVYEFIDAIKICINT